MPYDYLEELSISDEGFRVYHETLEGLFRDAWDAVLGLMVEDPESIRTTKERVVRLKETEPELLLFDFLGELVFLKDAEDRRPELLCFGRTNTIYRGQIGCGRSPRVARW